MKIYVLIITNYKQIPVLQDEKGSRSPATEPMIGSLIYVRSALEGGAIFEGECQAAIRIGRGVVQQTAPELFAEGGDLAVLLLQNPEKVHYANKFS